MKISKSSWNAYRNKLARINQAASGQLIEFIEKHGLQDMESVIDMAYALVTKYGEASASLACEMYDELAEMAGVHLPAAEPAKMASRDRVGWELNERMKKSQSADEVGHTAGVMTKKAAAETMLRNAKRDGAEAAWIPSGDGCAYCRMLSSRGWEKPKNVKAHIHKNCKCEYAVRFKPEDKFEGYDPDAMAAEWKAAEGETTAEKLRSIERQQYAENREAIRERKKAEYANRKTE